VIATAILLCFAVTTSFAQRSFFPDSFYAFSSHMPPGAIHINPSGIHYSPYEGQKIDFGIITHNRWCYIVIKAKPPGDEEYILSVDNTSIDSVWLFLLTGEGARQATYTGGNWVPYDHSRKYVWHTLPLGSGNGEVYCFAAFYDHGKN